MSGEQHMTTTIIEPQAPATAAATSQLPDIAVLMRYQDSFARALATRYQIHCLLPGDQLERLPAAVRQAIRAVVTVGGRGLNPFSADDFPALELIAVTGAGYEQVDVAAARERGIEVSYGPGTNAACVADHALALLLAAARGVVRAGIDAASGIARPQQLAQLTGKKVGIIGLGHIGKDIARRLQGFDAEIFYHGRRPQADSAYHFVSDVTALAHAVDFLVVSCPGGSATRHLVNAGVLQALGPDGILVNVARGSVVDTTALAAALRSNTIAGAALDVIEGEPHVDPALRALPNLILTPHVAAQSPETQAAVLALLSANLESFFAGNGVLTPAPVALG